MQLSHRAQQMVDGILVDLGVSSHQIDCASRGFSFDSCGPLDMRIDSQSSLTAETIVNTWDMDAIANLLYDMGEEPMSRQIAREIVLSRPLHTTGDLATAVAAVIPIKYRRRALARCFQAIRIHVNDELGALKSMLTQLPAVLRPGGRFVAISFHSLEDRIIKQFFQSDKERWSAVTKKPLVPSAEEQLANTRSHSAKVRVYERIK